MKLYPENSLDRKFRLLFIYVIFLFVAIPVFPQAFNSQVLKDIPYVPSQTEKDTLRMVNLVLPIASKNYPLLIWIGGGAWSYGDRNEELDFAQKVASEGIAVACVGHRLSAAIWKDPKLDNGVQHPAHADDIACAVKWLVGNSHIYGFDKNKMFIGGYSSGAHLAMLLALDPTYIKSADLDVSIFKGVLPISGTYDIRNYHSVFKNGSRPELAKLHVESVFGSDSKEWDRASPVNYLENLKAPLFIMSDSSLYRYTKLFEEGILKTDFKRFETFYVHTKDHGELWRNLSYQEESPYRDLMVNFIKETLQNK